MRRIQLFPIDARLDQALDGGVAEFRLRYRADPGDAELVRSVVRLTLAMEGAPPPWRGYLAVDESSRIVVGSCAFKAAPAGGAVEIAYFTFPPFEGAGYATAMAARLLEIAWGATEVRTVVAHTLPEENPSCRVLRKLGFQHEGVVEDPDDGPVWRWTRTRPGAGRPGLAEAPLAH